jgi:hypothetical protein
MNDEILYGGGLDEHCLDSMTCGNKGCSGLNHETLIGKTTQQGVWEVVVPTWHDFDYGQKKFLTSSELHAF